MDCTPCAGKRRPTAIDNVFGFININRLCGAASWCQHRLGYAFKVSGNARIYGIVLGYVALSNCGPVFLQCSANQFHAGIANNDYFNAQPSMCIHNNLYTIRNKQTHRSRSEVCPASHSSNFSFDQPAAVCGLTSSADAWPNSSSSTANGASGPSNCTD